MNKFTWTFLTLWVWAGIFMWWQLIEKSWSIKTKESVNYILLNNNSYKTESWESKSSLIHKSENLKEKDKKIEN
jgi:amino acid permease